MSWRTGPEPCLCGCCSNYIFEIGGTEPPTPADRLFYTCPSTKKQLAFSGLRAWTDVPWIDDHEVVKATTKNPWLRLNRKPLAGVR